MTRKDKTAEMIVILHNVRSVLNVGSIFRTSDAAGVCRIYLCGITPAPIDRFGRDRRDLAKVALGAEKVVRWEQVQDTLYLLQRLKRDGFGVVSVEQDSNSINYKKIPRRDKVCFVFGSETEGLPQDILRASDVVAEIPMKGMKESLNVSVSAGIVLFDFVD